MHNGYYIISSKLKKMNDKNVLSIIESAKKKDRKAQTKLINLFWIDIFSFIIKKVQNNTIADEITVNVFSKVLIKLDSFNPNFEFKSWILSIANNTVIDHWRKKSKEAKYSNDNIENIYVQSHEELIISMEEKEKIAQIISSMNSNYQNIIRLRFFEEKNIKEIAQELNLSITNTKVRIMRAKKVLAELLKNNLN